MEKRYELKTALLAFFVTVFLFGAGFLVASIYNEYKVQSIERDYITLSEEMESLQLEEIYLETVAQNRSCELVEYQLAKLSPNLDATGRKLVAYQASKEFGSKFFDLKNRYALIQIRAWLNAYKSQRECNSDIVTILYFYELGCLPCEEQGFTLDYFKQLLGARLFVFSIDRETYLPIIDMILRDYDVKNVPTLIVNGEKYAALSKKELQEELCNNYREKPNFC